MPSLRDAPRIHHGPPKFVTAAFKTSPAHGKGPSEARLVYYDYSMYGPGFRGRERERPTKLEEIRFMNVRWAEDGLLIHPDDFDRLKRRLAKRALKHARQDGRWPPARLNGPLKALLDAGPTEEPFRISRSGLG